MRNNHGMNTVAAFARTIIALVMCIGAAHSADDATAPAPATAGAIATVASDGRIDVGFSGKSFAAISAGLFDQHWAGAGEQPDGGARHFSISVPGQPGHLAFNGIATVSATASATISATASATGAAVAVTYALTAAEAGSWNSVNVSLTMKALDVIGGGWSATSAHVASGSFPAQFGVPGLFTGVVSGLRISAAGGRTLTIDFPEPTPVLIQDDRKWDKSFTVRIRPEACAVTAGEVITIAMVLGSPVGITPVLDHDVVIQAGDEWIPLQPALDIVPGSALDWSAQGFAEAPAGTHGRVVAVGNHFAFAHDGPGTVRRFYGVNLCFTAQYLEHDESDRMADRLLRLGYNAVRIHHYDGALVTGDPATATWDAANRDRLDYLLAAFAKRGIYVTTDLYVSRTITAKDLGIDAAELPHDAFKVAVPVMPVAFDNWCAFARGLLGHVNPYTHLRLADDPGLGWLAMINEDNFENYYHDIVATPGLSAAWKSAWNAWLLRTYGGSAGGNAGGKGVRANLLAAWGSELKSDEDPAAGSVALPDDLGGATLRTSDTMRFLADTETAMFARMAAFIHGELKCPALLSDNSSWWNRPINQAARTHFDYVDDHFYIDHPRFLEKPWRLPSSNPNHDPVADGAPGGNSCLFTRLLDKPATITEFNYAAPGAYRAMGGLLTGALAGFQDLGGVWRFAYSHNRNSEIAPVAMDYFNLSSDPLAQAGDRAAISLFVRGDIAPAPRTLALTMTPADLAAPPAAIPTLSPTWSWMAWLTGVGTEVLADGPGPVAGALPLSWAAPVAGTPAPYGCDDETLLAWAKQAGAVAAGNPTRIGHVLCSDGGAIVIDRDTETLRIDTAKTGGGACVAGGGFTLPVAGVAVAGVDVPATVFAIALDGKALRQSTRILVTHLTDLQNTGAHFGETARRTLLEWGKLPYLVHAGAATVTLNLPQPSGYTVWRLGVDGGRLGRVESTVGDGTLTFTATVAAPEGACMLYEVVSGK